MGSSHSLNSLDEQAVEEKLRHCVEKMDPTPMALREELARFLGVNQEPEAMGLRAREYGGFLLQKVQDMIENKRAIPDGIVFGEQQPVVITVPKSKMMIIRNQDDSVQWKLLWNDTSDQSEEIEDPLTTSYFLRLQKREESMQEVRVQEQSHVAFVQTQNQFFSKKGGLDSQSMTAHLNPKELNGVQMRRAMEWTEQGELSSDWLSWKKNQENHWAWLPRHTMGKTITESPILGLIEGRSFSANQLKRVLLYEQAMQAATEFQINCVDQNTRSSCEHITSWVSDQLLKAEKSGLAWHLFLQRWVASPNSAQRVLLECAREEALRLRKGLISDTEISPEKSDKTDLKINPTGSTRIKRKL